MEKLHNIFDVLKCLFHLFTMGYSNNIAFVIWCTYWILLKLWNGFIIIVISMASHQKTLICSSRSPYCSANKGFRSFAFNKSLNSKSSTEISWQLGNTRTYSMIPHQSNIMSYYGIISIQHLLQHCYNISFFFAFMQFGNKILRWFIGWFLNSSFAIGINPYALILSLS